MNGSAVLLAVAKGHCFKEVVEILEDSGFSVIQTTSGEQALTHLQEGSCAVVISSLELEDMEGWDLLGAVKESHPDVPVILLAEHGDIDQVIRAIRVRAADYFIRPFKTDELSVAVHRARRVSKPPRVHRPSKSINKNNGDNARIVGRSRVLKDLLAKVKNVATTDASVLIQGESGTGKELFASAIHHLSPRASNQLVAVNCVALAENLIESELFGHEKGAFTGAHQRRRGRFELAHEGTLFLDEIGDLAVSTQLKLLRALQEREIERVGGHIPIKVNVRIIAATNRDLEAALKQGTFREELYYRLKVVTLHIPPLRERTGDIPILLHHFIKLFRVKYRKRVKEFSPAALHWLCNYPWPGNVRELRNIVESLVVTNRSGTIEVEDLPRCMKVTSGSTSVTLPLGHSIEEVERTYIMRTLDAFEGNKAKAAKALGISAKTLYRRLAEYENAESERRDAEIIELPEVSELGS